MKMSVGCEFVYESAGPTPAVMLVEPHPDGDHRVLEASWEAQPALDPHQYLDGFGNRCRRFVLPRGQTTLRYDAVLRVSDDPDPVAPDAQQVPVERLPDDALVFTLASRYCLSDTLSNVAWHLFGDTEPGWARVQAVCDWINAHIRYGIKSTPLTTAADVYTAGGGVCRDLAHLGVTFCRALNIPARYVFGYIPDLDVPLPPPLPPMDFHAWFEVYLGDRWWAFDARFNTPLRGRVPIGRGRDAVDVAMMTTYGAARFKQRTVWTDATQVGTEAEPSAHAAAHAADAIDSPEDSETEALVLSHENG